MLTDKIKTTFEEAHGFSIETAKTLYDSLTQNEQGPYNPSMAQIEKENLRMLRDLH